MKRFFSKFNIFLSTLLLVGATFSIITVVNAVTPNPGHSWSETGDGIFAVTGPTTLRTYTFPDANASIAILGANTFTATQSINTTDPQLRLTNTTVPTLFSEFQVNSAGNLLISANGSSVPSHVRINEGNLWVCASGACGTSVTTTHPVVTNGNIVVENAVILDNNFQLQQTGATTAKMLDSGGNTILEFDEAQ